MTLDPLTLIAQLATDYGFHVIAGKSSDIWGAFTAEIRIYGKDGGVVKFTASDRIIYAKCYGRRYDGCTLPDINETCEYDLIRPDSIDSIIKLLEHFGGKRGVARTNHVNV